MPKNKGKGGKNRRRGENEAKGHRRRRPILGGVPPIDRLDSAKHLHGARGGARFSMGSLRIRGRGGRSLLAIRGTSKGDHPKALPGTAGEKDVIEKRASGGRRNKKQGGRTLRRRRQGGALVLSSVILLPCSPSPPRCLFRSFSPRSPTERRRHEPVLQIFLLSLSLTSSRLTKPNKKNVY